MANSAAFALSLSLVLRGSVRAPASSQGEHVLACNGALIFPLAAASLVALTHRPSPLQWSAKFAVESVPSPLPMLYHTADPMSSLLILASLDAAVSFCRWVPTRSIALHPDRALAFLLPRSAQPDAGGRLRRNLLDFSPGADGPKHTRGSYYVPRCSTSLVRRVLTAFILILSSSSGALTGRSLLLQVLLLLRPHLLTSLDLLLSTP